MIPGSWRHCRSVSRSRWMRHSLVWFGCPDRWRWSPPCHLETLPHSSASFQGWFRLLVLPPMYSVTKQSEKYKTVNIYIYIYIGLELLAFQVRVKFTVVLKAINSECTGRHFRPRSTLLVTVFFYLQFTITKSWLHSRHMFKIIVQSYCSVRLIILLIIKRRLLNAT